MLRTLLLIAVPFTTLLAGMPPLEKTARLSQQNLADIPLAQTPEKEESRDQSKELAQVRESAERGDLNAQARLGVMYYWGDGAPLDWEQAQVWLRKASERGHADAQAKLGAMCFLGQGGPRDLVESIKWFRLAAEQGEPYAQGCMGVMYAVGEGVPRDLVQAYVWLIQAQAGGDADAAEPLQQVKNHMTPTQLKEADLMVQKLTVRGTN
jgi:TPR repeat protein